VPGHLNKTPQEVALRGPHSANIAVDGPEILFEVPLAPSPHLETAPRVTNFEKLLRLVYSHIFRPLKRTLRPRKALGCNEKNKVNPN
jgi:hypothetical protein